MAQHFIAGAVPGRRVSLNRAKNQISALPTRARWVDKYIMQVAQILSNTIDKYNFVIIKTLFSKLKSTFCNYLTLMKQCVGVWPVESALDGQWRSLKGIIRP